MLPESGGWVLYNTQIMAYNPINVIAYFQNIDKALWLSSWLTGLSVLYEK